MPLPWRRNVDKVQIVSRYQTLKVTLAISVDAGRLLAGLFDQLRRPETFVFHYIANSIHYYFVDREKLSQNIRTAQANTDDSETDHIARLKLHADHGRVLRGVSLCGMRVDQVRRG